MHEAGHANWCSGTTQRDWVGRELRGGFSMGGYMYICGGFMLIYDKNNCNIVNY